MQRLRAIAQKLSAAIFPAGTVVKGESALSRLGTPHTFGPELSAGDALVAVAACLARIFGVCVLLALWGGSSALAWGGIESHFWRALAVLALVLLFLAGIASLLIAVSAVERTIAHKR